jgi:hypothetical protein
MSPLTGFRVNGKEKKLFTRNPQSYPESAGLKGIKKPK